MVASTAIPKSERKMVAPSANEKAAPEFRTKVNWKNDPSTLIFGRCERVLTAQIFVARSKTHTNQATLNSVRHLRTVSAVLPSACTACRELRVGKPEDELYQLEIRTLRNFHNSCYRCALEHVQFAEPCHVH